MPTVEAVTTRNRVRVLVRRIGITESVSTPVVVKVATPRIKVIAVARRGLQGANGLGAEALVIGETPSGAINGSNATFTTDEDFIPESVAVFLNGLMQKRVAEFNTIGNDTITLSESPTSGEILLVNYLKA